jgi:hypothetical protein
MFHDKRVWSVSPVGSAEELAKKLTEITWCCCNAFELGGYLWLNDSTSPDGAQEFGLLKKDGGNGKPVQIESITFGWCDASKALEYILRTLAGGDDQSDFRHEVDPVLQTPAEHGRCHHCA